MSYKMEDGQHAANEFHIAHEIRKKYELNEQLFSTDGRVIFSNFAMVRQLVYRINKNREPDQHLYAGEVNAAGLLDEIFHILLRRYESEVNPKVFSRLRSHLMDGPQGERYRMLLLDFAEKFPPQRVYQGMQSPSQYLMGYTGGRSNLEITIEECLMLFFSNINPANKKLIELFDNSYLNSPPLFLEFIETLDVFFQGEPGFGPEQHDIFSILKAPIENAPDDLNAQLEFILGRWNSILPDSVRLKILQGQDLMREDVRLEGGSGGPAPTMAPRYKGFIEDAAGFSIGKSGFRYAMDVVKDYEEYEHFTTDTHWMPKVVMIAKNTWVWLDQLSKKYKRDIRRLDQIPDQELDQLAQWHINGLWLIGIWERSSASKRIKHIMGNIDAVSSAYSLYDYEIAADLGGEQAFQQLNHRARQRGIRLAGDMVPNHTGIFSRWVVEHPDYFIQTQHPPFPGYDFSGENLSADPSISIYLEKGYYNRTDASVVFQRIDNQSGEKRYIYHGNDGTLMPWNDTAQLDFLKKEVREAVIQKIFDVARKFSIIRFDAAMTLAKKHFARLWYPRPGTGGDIASRADHAMSQKAFDELFPVEFWREVVDRMNNEMPETLLLAEAFWFMEGYFVRTLGMHRVYNSAFMHMLNNEENVKYRELITNTLEFEPEILKRYVNFMSNPDEETAIRQFGTGDKYFGICILMTTLPGLPMFGHGQIEGYTEKYGMEYQRAYYNEDPNQWLIEKHEKEVFPLIAKRYIFSEVENFNFFDYIDQHGNINENVMAYTNHYKDERALVLYNNKYEQASGQILTSAPKLDKKSGNARTYTLAQALEVNPEEKVYYIFREHISGMEYLKTGREIHQDGFHWNLNGFEYRVFLDFRQEYDSSGELEVLHRKLAGKGVGNINNALAEIRLQPLHEAFEKIFYDKCLNPLSQRLVHRSSSGKEKQEFTQAENCLEKFLQILTDNYDNTLARHDVLKSFNESLDSVDLAMEFIDQQGSADREKLALQQVPLPSEVLVTGSNTTYRENLYILLAHFVLKSLTESKADKEKADLLIKKLKLHWPLHSILAKTGRGPNGIARDVSLVQILNMPSVTDIFDLRQFSLFQPEKTGKNAGITPRPYPGNKIMQTIIESELAKSYLSFNQYKGNWYFSKEHFEELLRWLFSVSVFEYFSSIPQDGKTPPSEEVQNKLIEALHYLVYLQRQAQDAGYQPGKLKKSLQI